MIDSCEVRKFVHCFYTNKDSMHDLNHVDRLLSNALRLAQNTDCDRTVLTLAAYFHGIYPAKSECMKDYMNTLGLDECKIRSVFLATSESMACSAPQSIEGTLLHDAHLIEGGKAYLVTKSLVTGAERGQTLEETVQYMKDNILGKRKCVTPEAQEIYLEMEKYARNHISELEKGYVIT